MGRMSFGAALQRTRTAFLLAAGGRAGGDDSNEIPFCVLASCEVRQLIASIEFC